MYTKAKYVFCAACFFVLVGCEKKSEAPAGSEAAATPVAELVSITPSLSLPIDKAVVDVNDSNPCFSWAPLNAPAFESYMLTVSTISDFPTTRWQYKLSNNSETSMCWNSGAVWVAKGSNPPSDAANLTPGVTYYWRVVGRYSGKIVFSETRTFTMAAPSASTDSKSAKE